jgi:hypothetical protein
VLCGRRAGGERTRGRSPEKRRCHSSLIAPGDRGLASMSRRHASTVAQIVGCFASCLAAGPLDRPYSGAASARLEFKDVVASPCKLVQVGKRTTLGVASTALDGGSPVEVGWRYQFDRQAAAMIAVTLNPGLSTVVLCAKFIVLTPTFGLRS